MGASGAPQDCRRAASHMPAAPVPAATFISCILLQAGSPSQLGSTMKQESVGTEDAGSTRPAKRTKLHSSTFSSCITSTWRTDAPPPDGQLDSKAQPAYMTI